MKEKYFQKLISMLVTVGIVFVPFSSLLSARANAQTTTITGSGSGLNYGGGSGSKGLSGYLSGLAPAISQLPLCSKGLKSGIKSIFGGSDSSSGSGVSTDFLKNPINSNTAPGVSSDFINNPINSNTAPDNASSIDNNPMGGGNQQGAMNFDENSISNEIGGSADIVYPDAVGNSGLLNSQGLSNEIGGSGDLAQVDFQKSMLESDKTDSAAASGAANLTNVNASSALKANSVSTYDQGAIDAITGVKTNTANTNKNVASMNKNDTCLKSIGRLVIKMLLQKITLATVNWINSGFNGSPAFLQDPGKFFDDIAKNEILQFKMEINNSTLFPFGKTFMQQVASNYNRKFTDNAQYSLDKMIKDTNSQNSAVTFNKDFSKGGWGAWEAMTQVPANNPLGFQLMASNELGRRLQGTNKSTAQKASESLQQSNGFLGDQRCVDPAQGSSGKPITKEENDKAIKERAASPNGPYQYTPCKKWQYVTPGQLVAQEATSAINYPNSQLLQAQDLNDAMGAIIDALLNQFNVQIIQKGFTGLEDLVSASDKPIIDSSNNNDNSTTNGDFNDTQVNNSTWLQENPNFDIRTDLNQALIDAQRTYVDKLKKENYDLQHSTDVTPTTISGQDGLIPAIYQLDYCIPGPHPGWEADSQTTLSNVEQNTFNSNGMNYLDILGKTDGPEENLAKSVTGSGFLSGLGEGLAWIGKLIGIMGPDSIDSIKKAASGLSWTEKTNRILYAEFLKKYTGVLVADGKGGDSGESSIESYDLFNNILNTIFSKYQDAIKKTYTSDVMPSTTAEAKAEFNKISGYNQMIQDNSDAIPLKEGMITELQSVKDAVDQLNSELAANTITEDDYNTSLQPYIDKFARLSDQLVSGDDIAVVDNLDKQIVDEQKHVMDMIQGPVGCEVELLNAPANLQTREPYSPSLPILYNYQNNTGFLKNGIIGNSTDPGNVYIEDLINVTGNGPTPTFEKTIGVY